MAAALTGEQRAYPRMNVNESISSTSSVHCYAHAKEICFNYSESVQLAALPSPPYLPLVMKKSKRFGWEDEQQPRTLCCGCFEFIEVLITIFCLLSWGTF